jgi:hypothetical protein
MAPPWASQLNLSNPPMFAANNTAPPITIAGRPLSVRDRASGLLNLRIALQGGTASDFARDMAALGGVRVVRGPESIGRGACFLAHCPGYKLVLSTDDADSSVLALVSRALAEVGSEKTSPLSDMLTILMQGQPARPSDTSPWRKGFTFGKTRPPRQIASNPQLVERAFSAESFSGKKKPSSSAGAQPLRQTSLRPGKPLARKTPLSRRTPLGRRKSTWR